MADVLVVAEQQSGTLKKATLHALGAASELARRVGGKVRVLALGSGVGKAAEELRAYADVLSADAPVLEHYLAESYAPVVAEAARASQAGYVCAAATAGMRGNFVAVPTDCPQRDERQGWHNYGEWFVKPLTDDVTPGGEPIRDDN